jgi:tetratricopeptide (TPR) repeat protein
VEHVLLESARRADHWKLIRKVIPSDSVHFVALEGVDFPADIEDPNLARQLLQILDGTRDVREVVGLFPQRAFLAYLVLSRFVRDRLVRAAEADDLVRAAAVIAQTNPERARHILDHGLETEPQHAGLLGLAIRLAEEVGDPEGAAAALKVLAHLKLETGVEEEGHQLLLRARELAPGDTSVRERLLAMAIEAGQKDEAIHEGLNLVNLYRAPGLHAKARVVLERIVELEPDSVELLGELARTRVESGDPKGAIKELIRTGKRFISQEKYTEARQIFREILSIEPSHAEASHAIELIDSETYRRRRQKFRQLTRRLAAVAAVGVFAVLLYFEGAARVRYAEATSEVSREKLIEEQRYREAIQRFEEVAKRHPYTLTTLFDVRRRVQDLRAKIDPPTQK